MMGRHNDKFKSCLALIESLVIANPGCDWPFLTAAIIPAVGGERTMVHRGLTHFRKSGHIVVTGTVRHYRYRWEANPAQDVEQVVQKVVRMVPNLEPGKRLSPMAWAVQMLEAA